MLSFWLNGRRSTFRPSTYPAQYDVVALRLVPLAEDRHVLRPADLPRLGRDAVARVLGEAAEDVGPVLLAPQAREPHLLARRRIEELREEVDEPAELDARDVERDLVG